MTTTGVDAPTRTRPGPNWFAAVMGTGIVASAGSTLPVTHPLLTGFTTLVWALAVAALVAVTALVRGGTWHDHPVMAHFLGARAMAPMSVAAATLLAGHRVVGEPAAYALALALWLLGTALGVASALSPSIRAARRGRPEAVWLMPIVPPMVSAAVGALLAARSPEPLATVLVVASWACFALTLALAARPGLDVVRRVAGGDAPAAPTLFIVLGPLGQSATAALLLAPGRIVATAYAAVVVVAALVWLVVAAGLVLRQRPAFAMTWWAFTFPVGTVVTGLSGLAAATGSGTVAVAAVVLYAGLVAAWAAVGVRTLTGLRALLA